MDKISGLFGERLKSERKRLGMNQEEFASAGDVKKNTQIAYEQGRNFPDIAYLYALADIGVDIFYVFSGQVTAATLAPEENELLIGFRNLDIRGKAGVLALIDGMSAPPQPAAAPAFVVHGDVGQHLTVDVIGNNNVTMPSKKKKKIPEN